jgi:ubiquitin-like 1-activating enzyme E1 B
MNRVCLSNSLPLIDGGSTGLIGTVSAVIKGKTPCYECIPKMKPKQYPVCTIRSTPDKMIHCVVWAKLLLKSLFGQDDESNYIKDIGDELKICFQSSNSTLLFETISTKLFFKDIED